MSENNTKSGPAMKVLIVIALAVSIGATMIAKNASRDGAESTAESEARLRESFAALEEEVGSANQSTQPLPKLLDLGSDTCVPCKMMAPILAGLKDEYKEAFDVVFVDVFKNESAKELYDIRVIPTQIFFDAEGNELFRHEGFFSRENILGKWTELGVALGETPETEQ